MQPHFTFLGAVGLALGFLPSALSVRAEDARPVIMVGSSIHIRAVDPKTLSQILGRNVSVKTDLGAQACTKFFMVRSVCKGLREKQTSAVIVLEDRQNFMMIPNLRVHGKYRPKIMKWIGADKEALEIAERKAFSLPTLTYSGTSPVNLGTWDFEKGLEASFLPDIVRECGSSGVTLVVVLYPTVWNVENKTTPEMDKYRGAYAAYLEKNGGRLLDYTACPGLWLGMFNEGDHMGPNGQAAFTKLLGEDLQAFFAGKRAPRELTDPAKVEPFRPSAAPQASAAGPSPEAMAQAYLDQFREMENRLRPVQGKPAKYTEPQYFARNRGLLVRMATVARKILGEYGTTPAAGEARKVVARYDLPEKPEVAGNVSFTAEVTVESAPLVPDPSKIKPYVEAQRFVRCRVDRVLKGECTHASLLLGYWAIQKARKTESAQWKEGTRLRVEVDLYDAHPELATITIFEDPADIDLVPHWVWKAELLDTAGASPKK
jgi:hypothetical protein